MFFIPRAFVNKFLLMPAHQRTCNCIGVGLGTKGFPAIDTVFSFHIYPIIYGISSYVKWRKI